MAKEIYSKRSSTTNNASTPGKRQLKERGLQYSKDRSDAKIKSRGESNRDQPPIYDSRYPPLAQPEVAYAGIYRGDSRPSPPLSTNPPQKYIGYSREKGEIFESDEDRPLSRWRVASARVAQVFRHTPFPAPPTGKVMLQAVKKITRHASKVLIGRFMAGYNRLRWRCSYPMLHQRLQLARTQWRRSTAPAVGFFGYCCTSTSSPLLHRLDLDYFSSNYIFHVFVRKIWAAGQNTRETIRVLAYMWF